jgi:preprotein translocase subunit SecB
MIEAKKADFKFVKFKVPKFSYNETKEEKKEIKLLFNPSGVYNESERKFELTIDFLGYEEGQEDNPIISVSSVSIFKFKEDIVFNEIPEYFYTNSIAIVFPYLRAFISNLTLQANTGLIMLGLMNFIGMSEVLKQNTKKII